MKDLNMDNENFAAAVGPPLEYVFLNFRDSDDEDLDSSNDDDLDIGIGVNDEEPDHGFDSVYEDRVHNPNLVNIDYVSNVELDIYYNSGNHTAYYQCRGNESHEELHPCQVFDLRIKIMAVTYGHKIPEPHEEEKNEKKIDKLI